METIRTKYQIDNNFKALVDSMVAHIHQCNFTPSEMRQGAILASIIYEEHNFRGVVFVEKDVERAFKILHSYKDSNNSMQPAKKTGG